MCISTTSQPAAAQTAPRSGSPRSAVTSLTIAAPASSAEAATDPFEPGTRMRDRARALAAGLLGLGLDLRRLRFLGLLAAAEHVLGGLAGDQALELLGLDRLALEQNLREAVEGVAMVGQDVAGGL